MKAHVVVPGGYTAVKGEILTAKCGTPYGFPLGQLGMTAESLHVKLPEGKTRGEDRHAVKEVLSSCSRRIENGQ